MVLHTGAAEHREGDYYGDTLNRSDRLLKIANGGQILLSSATADLAESALPDGARLADLGLHRLRDLQRPERVFELRHADLPTGFGPLKAMLEHQFRSGASRPVHLFWGARARRDLYLHALAEDWARQHPLLRYTPVLSEPDDHWPGERGLVHEAVLRAHPDLSGHEIYMAGPPAMVHAGKLAFVKAGLDADHLYYDSFDYAFETWPTLG